MYSTRPYLLRNTFASPTHHILRGEVGGNQAGLNESHGCGDEVASWLKLSRTRLIIDIPEHFGS